MFYTMNRAHGIGLAAPQIGLDMALTVIDISKIEGQEKVKPMTLINPKILDSHGRITIEEGCLSIPYLRAEVTRPEKVHVEYSDLNLDKQTIELDGMIARVAQHEIDHLNGVLFIDHLDADEKKLLKKELSHIKRGEVETDYLLAGIPPKVSHPPAERAGK